MTKIKTLAILYVLAMLCECYAGAQAVQGEEPILLTKIHSFDLLNQTMVDGLVNISERLPRSHFGVEQVLRERYNGPALKAHKFSLHEDDKTLSQLLDNLCQKDPGYMWSLNGPTINVYPRNVADSPSYFLNRRLERVDFNDLRSADGILFSVIHRLIPDEQVAFCQVGGNDNYDVPWTASFSNITVRELLNEAAAHLGAHSYWVLSGSKDFRCFAFAKGTLHEAKAPDPK